MILIFITSFCCLKNIILILHVTDYGRDYGKSLQENRVTVFLTRHSLLQQPPKHCTCADSSFTGDTARFSATPCTECCREKMSEAGEQNLVELLLGRFC